MSGDTRGGQNMGLAVPMKTLPYKKERNQGTPGGGQPDALRSREGEGEEQALLRKRGLWEKGGRGTRAHQETRRKFP